MVWCPGWLCCTRADLRDLDASPNFTLTFPEPSNRLKMLVTVRPDAESWWYRGVYEFSLVVPDNYPHEAPKVHCNTKVRGQRLTGRQPRPNWSDVGSVIAVGCHGALAVASLLWC